MTIISVIKSNHDERIHTNSIILLHKNIFFLFFSLLITHLHLIHTCITQPTAFLPSNTSNFYVRQLTTANTAYVFFFTNKFRNTQHKRESGTLSCWKKYPLKNNLKNQNNHVRNLKMIQNRTRQMILIRTTFIYFIFQTGMVWKMRREM